MDHTGGFFVRLGLPLGASPPACPGLAGGGNCAAGAGVSGRIGSSISSGKASASVSRLLTGLSWKVTLLTAVSVSGNPAVRLGSAGTARRPAGVVDPGLAGVWISCRGVSATLVALSGGVVAVTSCLRPTGPAGA